MAGVPLEAELEPDRMTDAPVFKSGKTFCTVKMGPPTLRSNVSRKCCGVISANGANSPPPALVNTTSRPCPCALTASATLSTSSGSVTSPQIPLAEGPIDASASSRRCLSRPVMKTCAPPAASRLAAARPIPEVPPVTSAVLSLSCPMMFSVSTGLLLVCMRTITATALFHTRLMDGGTRRSAQRGFEVGAEDGSHHGVGDPRTAVSLNPVANRGGVADCAEVVDESLTDGKRLSFGVGCSSIESRHVIGEARRLEHGPVERQAEVPVQLVAHTCERGCAVVAHRRGDSGQDVKSLEWLTGAIAALGHFPHHDIAHVLRRACPQHHAVRDLPGQPQHPRRQARLIYRES